MNGSTANRPKAPRWEGDHIRWWGAADWEWIACVRCGRPLTTAKARRDGFGRDCATQVTPEVVAQVQSAEHAACRLALQVHQRAQTQKAPWWTHQAYLKRRSKLAR
jgi:hypothetical protein